jgi:hypothetical protein
MAHRNTSPQPVRLRLRRRAAQPDTLNLPPPPIISIAPAPARQAAVSSATRGLSDPPLFTTLQQLGCSAHEHLDSPIEETPARLRELEAGWRVKRRNVLGDVTFAQNRRAADSYQQ